MLIESAGLLMCRVHKGIQEFFLVHPGGPFFRHKNEGAWTIPKGIVESGEALLEAAVREFNEETGIEPIPPFYFLDTVKLKSGKIIHAWAFRGSWDDQQEIKSNHVELEWPPHSGKWISIPEADQGAWMNFEKAKTMINPAQIPFLERAKLQV